jgi:hypothetical protein
MQENFEKVLNNSLNPVNKKIIELIEFKETWYKLILFILSIYKYIN